MGASGDDFGLLAKDVTPRSEEADAREIVAAPLEWTAYQCEIRPFWLSYVELLCTVGIAGKNKIPSQMAGREVMYTSLPCGVM